jgi:hypothetical protein
LRNVDSWAMGRDVFDVDALGALDDIVVHLAVA